MYFSTEGNVNGDVVLDYITLRGVPSFLSILYAYIRNKQWSIIQSNPHLCSDKTEPPKLSIIVIQLDFMVELLYQTALHCTVDTECMFTHYVSLRPTELNSVVSSLQRSFMEEFHCLHPCLFASGRLLCFYWCVAKPLSTSMLPTADQ